MRSYADTLINYFGYSYNMLSNWNVSIDGVYWNRTNPNKLDTDEDGIDYGREIKYNLNPKFDDANYDGDLLTNIQEVNYETDPSLENTDFDGLDDKEVNIIYFVGEKMNNKQWYVSSNGLDPYSIDTDGDGINDSWRQKTLDTNDWGRINLTGFNS